MDIININSGLHVSLFKKGEFERPVELSSGTFNNNFMKFELTVGDATRLVAVLTQYLEENGNG